MTAHTLARLLLEGPDLPMYINGYEGGVSDLTAIEPVQVIRDRNAGERYVGRHEAVGPWGDEEAGVPGLLLPR